MGLLTVEDIDFLGYKSFIKGFCRCGCWQLTTFYKGRFMEYIRGHNSKKENNPNWNGGEYPDKDGYTHILKPDHPYCDSRGYVKKHRLVVEKQEKRDLRPEERIHHIKPVSKGGTDDIENLMLFANHAEHQKFEKKKDMSNRYCSLCGGKTYIEKNGREHWHKYENEFICKNCYNKKKRGY